MGEKGSELTRLLDFKREVSDEETFGRRARLPLSPLERLPPVVGSSVVLPERSDGNGGESKGRDGVGSDVDGGELGGRSSGEDGKGLLEGSEEGGGHGWVGLGGGEGEAKNGFALRNLLSRYWLHSHILTSHALHQVCASDLAACYYSFYLQLRAHGCTDRAKKWIPSTKLQKIARRLFLLEHRLDGSRTVRLGSLEGHTESSVPDDLGDDTHSSGDTEETVQPTYSKKMME